MVDLNLLNKEQREAVLAVEGPLLILAGAGSGKTRVLTYRIAHLIEDMGVYPGSILAITFTNKAAGEMKERIEHLIGAAARDMWISTFHSTCVRILRREIERLGYTRNFVIYDTTDQQTLMKHCFKELDVDDKLYPQRMVLDSISRAKNELVKAENYLKGKEFDFRAKKITELYSLYQKKLMQNNALDFDDIIMKTVELFEKDIEVLDFYQHKFKYIHVDEYQDTNFAQYRFISLLAQKHKNLCVVGDDDQSIYGFRGADIRNILEFEKDYPDTKVIKLEQNYRSTKYILDAANGVIRNNRGRKSKNLWTDIGGGEKITIYEASNEHEEAQYVASTILKGLSEGRSFDDYAVLYRTNAQSRVIEEMFMKNGIPYTIVGGLKFYDRKEVKDIVAYLKVILNPSDDISLRRIINVPKRNIGDTTLDKISAFASQTGMNLMEAVFRADNIPGLSPRTVSSVNKFGMLIRKYMDIYKSMSVPELLEDLIESTGYVHELESSGDIEDESRIENIKEFISAAGEFDNTSEDRSLEAFLQGIALVSDIDTVKDDSRGVTIMTLHSAKGLEFPVVFMTGMEQGIFPHIQSMGNEDEIEEERRICYVGMTRAELKLYMTRAYIRTLFGNTQCNSVSDFLNEIPENCIEGMGERNRKNKTVKETAADKIVKAVPILTKKEESILSSGDKIKPGCKVNHKIWGPGTIVTSISKGDDFEITVAFDSQGIKKLSAKYAPIEFLG